MIGRGAYSEVFQAEDKVSKQYFAIKRTSKALILFKNCVENILREKELMMDLDSEFVVKLLHTFQNKEHLYMV
jgi:serine/threonine protein kinase